LVSVTILVRRFSIHDGSNTLQMTSHDFIQIRCVESLDKGGEDNLSSALLDFFKTKDTPAVNNYIIFIKGPKK
jgi:hypothetical protein